MEECTDKLRDDLLANGDDYMDFDDPEEDPLAYALIKATRIVKLTWSASSQPIDRIGDAYIFAWPCAPTSCTSRAAKQNGWTFTQRVVASMCIFLKGSRVPTLV